MYYTKLIVQDHAETTLNDAYIAAIEERWKFIEDGNGLTKCHRDSPSDSYQLNTGYNYTALESKAFWDGHIGAKFKPSVTYHEVIKVWNTQEAAEGWVAAVQALALPGITISYHGTTDPTV